MSRIIHQITSGIAGWLTFEQMQGGVDNLREAELKKPIELIARGRGCEVKGEFPIPTESNKKGAPPSLDFLIIQREQKLVVALEIKYKKTGRRMAGSIGFDAARLHNLNIENINRQIKAGKAHPITKTVTGFNLIKAVIVAWHQSAILEQIALEPPIIRRQFINLVTAMLPEDVEANSKNFSSAMLGVIATRPVANRSGSLRAGSTVTHRRFWVASFLGQEYWQRIRSPNHKTGTGN
ncbi:hypothetical protein [Belnapia sp. F-4-1]|uniref:hypothetical protein n=1 Tax=Belnapia sp. F-4-1 TaxID=1545443 RepID=UPI001184F1B8|nr:hypothetical protein [Belnapia sp. F-4-1]